MGGTRLQESTPIGSKVLSERLGRDDDGRRHIEREAKAISRLNHPHIRGTTSAITRRIVQSRTTRSAGTPAHLQRAERRLQVGECLPQRRRDRLGHTGGRGRQRRPRAYFLSDNDKATLYVYRTSNKGQRASCQLTKMAAACLTVTRTWPCGVSSGFAPAYTPLLNHKEFR
jgi:hypothetical protein